MVWGITRTPVDFGAGAPQLITADLFALWLLDDGSGTTPDDTSGNARHQSFVVAPTWITEGLRFANAHYTKWTGDWTPTAFSIYVIYKQSGTDAQYNQNALIGGADDGVGTEFTLHSATAGTPWSFGQHKSGSGDWGCCANVDKSWGMIAFTWDGATSKLWLNNGILLRSWSASGAKAHTGIELGTFVVAQFFRGDMAAAIVYDAAAHTVEQIASQWAWAKALMAERGVTMGSPSGKYLVIDGDSLASKNTLFQNTLTPPLRDNLTGTWNFHNLGYGGKTTAQLVTDFADKITPALAGASTATRRVYAHWSGHNSLATQTPAQVYASQNQCRLAAIAAGADATVLVTTLPTNSGGYNEATYNEMIALQAGNADGWDEVIDLSGVAGIGGWADPAGVNYDDGVHLDASGYAIVGPLIATGCNAA